MRRKVFTILTIFILTAMTASAVLAVSVHFKHGSPVFTKPTPLTLRASGTLAGLGYGDVVIVMTATGNPTAVCTNPAGATQPPGQNPAQVTVQGTGGLTGAIKNGNASFSVTTPPPQSPIPGAPECPNPQWTETITAVAFTSARIQVYQNNILVLDKTFVFSPPL